MKDNKPSKLAGAALTCMESAVRDELVKNAKLGQYVVVERKDGHLFELKAAVENCSPLDVEGIDLGISTEEVVWFVREGRNRYGEGV
jgi:hypothetical protein